MFMLKNTQKYTHQDLVETEHGDEATEETPQLSDSEVSSDLELHRAVLRGDLKEVKRLVEEEHLDASERGRDGYTQHTMDT